MKKAFHSAKQVLVGGVNSPVRSFAGVGGDPVFIRSAQGAYMTDINSKQYIDYVNSWGANLLGHADSRIVSAVQAAAENGLSFGAPTELETQCAKLLIDIVNNNCDRSAQPDSKIDKVRFVSSGTEAVMTAIRLARGISKKDKIIKFAGNYHGHSDSLLVTAGSGALTLGVPSSPGVPKSIAEQTLSLPYNDLDALEQCFKDYGEQIAAVVIEPIAGNMNFVMAKKVFLQKLRQLCDQYNSILIFDEVMSGFRVAAGGAQSLYKIYPDLTTYAKVIGGGMPVGALAGPNKFMQHLAPEGEVYQAGTLSGNPIAMSAGIAVLSEIYANKNLYQDLEKKCASLVNGLIQIAKDAQVNLNGSYAGGMFGLYFSELEQLGSFDQVMQCDKNMFNKFFHHCLNEGVYFAPSAFEAGFVSAAHTQDDIDKTLEVARGFFNKNKNKINNNNKINNFDSDSEFRNKVVLVNKDDQVIGSADKLTAHQNGDLHRAFSVFIFSKQDDGKLLVLMQKEH